MLATVSPTIAPSELMVLITNTDMFGQLDISGCREAEPERERPGRERPTTCPSYLIVYFKYAYLDRDIQDVQDIQDIQDVQGIIELRTIYLELSELYMLCICVRLLMLSLGVKVGRM